MRKGYYRVVHVAEGDALKVAAQNSRKIVIYRIILRLFPTTKQYKNTFSISILSENKRHSTMHCMIQW